MQGAFTVNKSETYNKNNENESILKVKDLRKYFPIKKGFFKKDIIPGIAKRALFGALDEMSRYWVLSSRRKYDIETAAKQVSEYFLNGLTAR